MIKEIEYLAGPYSHPDKTIQQQRFEALNKVAAHLMAKGHFIYSPISHTHPIALAGKLPTDFDFWEKYDRAFLAVSKGLIVATFDGWQFSKGVTAEIKIADELDIPITFLNPRKIEESY